MGRKPNARGGRGRMEFVARGGRGDSRPRGRHGQRDARGRGGGGAGGGRGDAAANAAAGHGSGDLVLGVESQRLILDLLQELHIDETADVDGAESDGDDGGAEIESEKVDTAELLQLLVDEERKNYVESSLQAAMGAKAQRRQLEMEHQQKKGRGAKVRLIIAAWHHPDTTQKRVIIARAPTLSTLFSAAREVLFIKRPKAAYLLETTAYISDTMSLEDDTVVVIATKLPESAQGDGGSRAKVEEGPAVGERDAAVAQIKEAYKRRAESGGSKREAWAEDQAQSRILRQELLTAQEKSDYAQMLQTRMTLPAWPLREEIVRTIEASQVVVLSGETGSGKTTQVPQFLLDSLILAGRGSEVNILCTQPRRISAVGVAERVAAERCEEVGRTVAYSIRLETRASGRTRLCFLTTGVLLRRLQDDPDLRGVSHVLVDEVHERDLQTDFLLIILKALLTRRPDLKVVLMSATLQASLFCEYFGNCPTIHVPGRTFRVHQNFLEDIECLLSTSSAASRPGSCRGGGRGNRGAVRGGGGGRGQRGGRGSFQRDGPRTAWTEEGRGQGRMNGNGGEKPEDEEKKALLISPKAEEPIDYDLLMALLEHLVSQPDRSDHDVCADGPRRAGAGAVLIFLPGFGEIEEVLRRMASNPLLGDARRVQSFPLHSTLPPEAQRGVFKRMPAGVRKVVVATNIAETSITIDDVVHVIDVGRVKETRYDAATHMSSLVAVWTSQASASQRAGRAGRVREGDCWRLYTGAFMQENMPEYTLPEMLRTPLEELCLDILSLELATSPGDFLCKAIQPPPAESVNRAMKNLREIDAVRREKDQETKHWNYYLTPLGYHLAYLPVDVRIGKMLIVGAILDCLEPILTIAACLSYKSPFCKPFGMQEEADRAHARFASSGSDHIAALEAYNGWAELRREPYRVRKEYCQDNFLSIATLEMLYELRKQCRQQLVEIGFAPRQPPPQDTTSARVDGHLIQCVLCAGLYPNIGKLLRPQKPGEVACFDTRDKIKVFVHPSSTNFKRLQSVPPRGRDAYMLWHKCVQSTKVYAYDSTFASPFTLLLFAGDIKIEREQSLSIDRTVVSIDKWLVFRMTEHSAVLIKYLRKEIDRSLLRKISDPSLDVAQQSRSIVHTLQRLLAADSNLSGL